MSKPLAAILCGEGANLAIKGLMRDYAAALTEAGIATLELTFEPGELEYLVKLMSKGEIDFAITWLGLGQDLAGSSESNSAPRNLFEYYGVPLVKLQGDLPAYYIDFHRDIPRNAINLYQADEFVAFRRRWLPEARAITGLIPPIPMVPMERNRIDLRQRQQGHLFFVKNGNSPTALKAMWLSELPQSVGKTLVDMSASLEGDSIEGRIDFGDWVARFLEGDGMKAEVPPRLVWFYAAQLDDYLRRVKSTMIAEAILDFPVVVQGSFWDHVDFVGKRATRADAMDVFASQEIVEHELGVIDMSANVDTWPHDRIQRAAGSYALAITNKQGWLAERFPEFSAMTFEFNPEEIRHRVADVLAHPERYLEMAVEFGERFRAVYPRTSFAKAIVPLVEQSRLLWRNPPPALQNFFVWSKV